MITHFTDPALGNAFKNGKLFPPSKNEEQITVYIGSLEKCHICDKKSSYLIVDAKICSRILCCSACASEIIEKRPQLIDEINRNFRDKYGDMDSDDEESEYLDDHLDAYELYVIMSESTGAEHIYLVSYREIIEQGDMESDFHIVHKERMYLLPSDFILI